MLVKSTRNMEMKKPPHEDNSDYIIDLPRTPKLCIISQEMKTKGVTMVNKVILIGRLGADPEVRYTQDGTMVTNFRLATDEQWKDKSGEKVQKTEWHRVITFRKLAEICGNYLAKGRLVYIEGRIQTRSWDDRDGNKRYTTEIVASNMQMLERKGDEAGQAGGLTGDSQGYKESEFPEDDVPF